MRRNAYGAIPLGEEQEDNLGLEWYIKGILGGMSREEKQSMMVKMVDGFFSSMTPEEKKELMKQMMPRMMEKIIEGMTRRDKQELISTIMPAIMSQMFGGGGIPSMKAEMMTSLVSGEKEAERGEAPRMPVMETQEDFKPWEFCLCKKLCEEGFKKKSES